jgi:hypothetical protein
VKRRNHTKLKHIPHGNLSNMKKKMSTLKYREPLPFDCDKQAEMDKRSVAAI